MIIIQDGENSLRCWRSPRTNRQRVHEAAAGAAKEGSRDYGIKAKSGGAYTKGRGRLRNSGAVEEKDVGEREGVGGYNK